MIAAAAAGDVDVRGYTELANVMLKPAPAMQTSHNWRANSLGRATMSATRRRHEAWKSKDLGVRLNVQLTNQGQRRKRKSSPRRGGASLRRRRVQPADFGEFLINGTSTGPRPRRTRSTSPAV